VIGRSGDQKNELTAETRSRGERSGNREIGKSGDWKALALEMMNRLMQTIRATLREIFDESAYERFLLRTHASRSTASYREFIRERDAAMLKRPRCC
jgi:hypothetical protein